MHSTHLRESPFLDMVKQAGTRPVLPKAIGTDHFTRTSRSLEDRAQLIYLVRVLRNVGDVPNLEVVATTSG